MTFASEPLPVALCFMWGKTQEKIERGLFTCFGASLQAAAEMELGCSTCVSSEHPGNRGMKQGLADGVGGRQGRQTGNWCVLEDVCIQEREKLDEYLSPHLGTILQPS